MSQAAQASARLKARLKARALARSDRQATRGGSVTMSSSAQSRCRRREQDLAKIKRCVTGSLPQNFVGWLEARAPPLGDNAYVVRHPQFMNVSSGQDLTGDCVSTSSLAFAQYIRNDSIGFERKVRQLGARTSERGTSSYSSEKSVSEEPIPPHHGDAGDAGADGGQALVPAQTARSHPGRSLFSAVEVGAGLGVPSLLLSQLLHSKVVATDGNRIAVQVLRLNAALHAVTEDDEGDSSSSHTHRQIHARLLKWGDDDAAKEIGRSFHSRSHNNPGPHLVFCCDCFSEYADSDVRALAGTLLACVGPQTVVAVAFEKPSSPNVASDGDTSSKLDQQHEQQQIVQNKFQFLSLLLLSGGLEFVCHEKGQRLLLLPSLPQVGVQKSRCYLALFRRCGDDPQRHTTSQATEEGVAAEHHHVSSVDQHSDSLAESLPRSVDAQEVASKLQTHGFCVIDDFLPSDLASLVRKDAAAVMATPERFFQHSSTPSQKAQQHIRSDLTLDVDSLSPPNRTQRKPGETPVLAALSKAARILQFPVAKAIGAACGEKVYSREQPQFAVYPAKGSFYVEHLDNPRFFDQKKDNGRRLTAVCVATSIAFVESSIFSSVDTHLLRCDALDFI